MENDLGMSWLKWWVRWEGGSTNAKAKKYWQITWNSVLQQNKIKFPDSAVDLVVHRSKICQTSPNSTSLVWMCFCCKNALALPV